MTLVSDESAPNAARLGDAVAARIRGWLEDDGVTLRLGAEVERIARERRRLAVHAEATCSRGALVVMASGVAPRSELARAAGVQLGDDGRGARGRHDAHVARRICSRPATSRSPATRPQDDRCASSTGATRSPRARSRGAPRPARRRSGRDVPGFWSTIGTRTLKHAAWGDGFDDVRFEARAERRLHRAGTEREGRLVGVLAHEADDDYERGRELIAAGAAW